jgi:hypothetical protein
MSHARFLGAAALAAALSLPAPAAAQSLLAARGLGYLLEATDARGRGLGGAAVGLPDAALSLVSPAELAGLPAAGIAVTLHGDRVDPDVALADAFETSRFPAVQVAFPVRDRLVVSVGYASVLDQNWSTSRFDSVDVAGGRTLVTDRFSSSGGVARFRPGVAYRLGGRLDLGVALDVYTGVLRDSTVRVIENLATTGSGGDYAWRGTGFGAGLRWRGEALTVSTAVSGGSRLRAVPRDSGAVEGSYALPLRVDAGASARIAQTALLVASGRWTGWSATGDDLGSGSARDALQGTGGVELEGLRLLGRPLPLRLGARLTQLPFTWEGAEYVDERALTAGAGIRFAGGAALLDLAGERGTRVGGGLDESFWRVSLSLQLLGR